MNDPRAAEQIVFCEVSTGVSEDLQRVTSIARTTVTHETLGDMVNEEDRQSFLGQSGPQSQERSFSEETAREIDCAVRGIVHAAFERTVALLTARRDVLETGAKQLLGKKTLTEPELMVLREALQASAATDPPAASAEA